MVNTDTIICWATNYLHKVPSEPCLWGEPHHHLWVSKLHHGALMVYQARQFLKKIFAQGTGHKSNGGVGEGCCPSGQEEPVLQVGCDQPAHLSQGGDGLHQLVAERHHWVQGKLALPPHDRHRWVESERHFAASHDLLHAGHLLHQLFRGGLVVGKTKRRVSDRLGTEHVEQPATKARVGQALGLTRPEGEEASNHPDVLGNREGAEEAGLRNGDRRMAWRGEPLVAAKEAIAGRHRDLEKLSRAELEGNWRVLVTEPFLKSRQKQKPCFRRRNQTACWQALAWGKRVEMNNCRKSCGKGYPPCLFGWYSARPMFKIRWVKIIWHMIWVFHGIW